MLSAGFLSECLATSTFTGVRKTFGRPGGCLFNVDPMARTESTPPQNRVPTSDPSTASELEMSAEGPL